MVGRCYVYGGTWFTRRAPLLPFSRSDILLAARAVPNAVHSIFDGMKLDRGTDD